jgi:uncharacterized membrane protein YedE/YeeE
MTIIYIITGLLMGIIFGFALEKGRVFEPGMIVGQFQLRNFIMVKMFAGAIAVTMIVFALLVAVGWGDFHPKVTIFPAVIFGGLVFGAGMALAGACPGTVLAQIGAGYKDSWAIVIGGLLGSITYGYLEPMFSSWNADKGEITLVDLTGLPFWCMALIAAILIVTIIYVLESRKSWKDELGSNYDGFLREPDKATE